MQIHEAQRHPAQTIQEFNKKIPRAPSAPRDRKDGAFKFPALLGVWLKSARRWGLLVGNIALVPGNAMLQRCGHDCSDGVGDLYPAAAKAVANGHHVRARAPAALLVGQSLG